MKTKYLMRGLVEITDDKSLNYGKRAELVKNYEGKMWVVRINGDLWRYRETQFSPA